jgi:hypothetical protein
MSRKVFDAIMAGIEAAVARAKAAGRVGETPPIKRPRRARRRPTDGYSRSEVTKLGASFPTVAASAISAASAFRSSRSSAKPASVASARSLPGTAR